MVSDPYTPTERHPDPDNVGVTGGGGSGGSNDKTGAFADPNGNVTPDDPTNPAFYYQESNSANNVWRWSVGGQAWFQFVNA